MSNLLFLTNKNYAKVFNTFDKRLILQHKSIDKHMFYTITNLIAYLMQSTI